MIAPPRRPALALTGLTLPDGTRWLYSMRFGEWVCYGRTEAERTLAARIYGARLVARHRPRGGRS